MDANIITPFEWFFLLLFVFITIISFYQACVNLFYGKVSRFSIDAILVFLFIDLGLREHASVSRHLLKTLTESCYLEFLPFSHSLEGFTALLRGFKELPDKLSLESCTNQLFIFVYAPVYIPAAADGA